MIEPIHDVVYLCLRQRIQGRIEHRWRKPIGALVESPLGMIGMGKITAASNASDGGMVSKLLAVIGRNRLGMPPSNNVAAASGPFAHISPPALRARPITKSISQSPMRLFASTIGRWSILTRSLICPRACFSIAFLAFLLTLAQIAIQRTARLAIRLNVLVDTGVR